MECGSSRILKKRELYKRALADCTLAEHKDIRQLQFYFLCNGINGSPLIVNCTY